MAGIRFLLGDHIETIDAVDPTVTVLQWLRVNGRTGTKEGCAEGDCGACTVVLCAATAEGRFEYRAVNSCILFLPTLDGKRLLTVEDMKDAAGNLHPVQQAMVECHASQCGFCTPGFVMSLFALCHQPGTPQDDEALHDVLAGNLCRCTGYRPIVDAGRKVLSRPLADRFSAEEPKIAAALAALRPAASNAVHWQGEKFFLPRRLSELAALLARHQDAVLLAGGTDLGLYVTKQHRRLGIIIYLGAVEELNRIAESPSLLTIGAGATYSQLLPVFARHWPSFGEMLSRLGSVQIRNSGTMGGNIANGSPIGDSMPALIALRARVILHRDGQRRAMPLEDFFLDYRKTALALGEFIERIEVPVDPAWRFATYKLSKRRDQDISAVALGIAVKLDAGVVADVRIAFGGMAATPKRAAAAEAALRGKPWNHAAVAAARAALAQDYRPLSDMRASDEYRRLAAGNLLLRFYHESIGETVRLGSPSHG